MQSKDLLGSNFINEILHLKERLSLQNITLYNKKTIRFLQSIDTIGSLQRNTQEYNNE